MIAEGRIIRGKWIESDTNGKEAVCLLVALSPEVSAQKDPIACPAEVMPMWLARLTPWINDAPTKDTWVTIINRYANLAGRWHVLDEHAWRRCEYACRAIPIREAMQFSKNNNATILNACDKIADACEAVSRGAELDIELFKSMSKELSNDREKLTVAWAAKIASSEEQDTNATIAAALSVVMSMVSVVAKSAADRMATAILDAIEAEIIKAENL